LRKCKRRLSNGKAKGGLIEKQEDGFISFRFFLRALLSLLYSSFLVTAQFSPDIIMVRFRSPLKTCLSKKRGQTGFCSRKGSFKVVKPVFGRHIWSLIEVPCRKL
jgi:hypothetical protein